MKQSVNNKRPNPAAIPYGSLLRELNNEASKVNLSVVIIYALKHYGYKTPLEMMAELTDQVFAKYKKKNDNSFAHIVGIANQLGWQVIGKPASDVLGRKSRAPFLGCQTLSSRHRLIYLQEALSVAMARAVIIHELMHTFFATVNHARPGGLPTDYIEEVLCDYGTARFLVDENYILLNKDHFNCENFAYRILSYSNILNVPRRYIALRIFDILSLNLGAKKVVAIIEWHLVHTENTNPAIKKLSPLWSITDRFYIPMACSAKENSVIYTEFFSGDSGSRIGDMGTTKFVSSNEEVSIGSLKGLYQVHVCAIGKIAESTRIAVSVFLEI